VAHGFSFKFLPYAVDDSDRHVDVYRLLKVNLEIPGLLAEIPPKINTLLDDNKDENIMSSVLNWQFPNHQYILFLFHHYHQHPCFPDDPWIFHLKVT
jgi:hypothetical protein